MFSFPCSKLEQFCSSQRFHGTLSKTWKSVLLENIILSMVFLEFVNIPYGRINGPLETREMVLCSFRMIYLNIRCLHRLHLNPTRTLVNEQILKDILDWIVQPHPIFLKPLFRIIKIKTKDTKISYGRRIFRVLLLQNSSRYYFINRDINSHYFLFARQFQFKIIVKWLALKWRGHYSECHCITSNDHLFGSQRQGMALHLINGNNGE